jgi:hypothetical protein
LAQLHQPPVIEEMNRLNAAFLVVSFAPLDHLKKWVPHFVENFLKPSYQKHGFEIPRSFFDCTRFVANPTLEVYHAYGMGRNTATKVFGRKILLQYARWKREGKPVQLPTEDPLQKGGDFVVDLDMKIKLAHVGEDQTDRPALAAILAAIAKV